MQHYQEACSATKKHAALHAHQFSSNHQKSSPTSKSEVTPFHLKLTSCGDSWHDLAEMQSELFAVAFCMGWSFM
jgi:hypothetical protein